MEVAARQVPANSLQLAQSREPVHLLLPECAVTTEDGVTKRRGQLELLFLQQAVEILSADILKAVAAHSRPGCLELAQRLLEPLVFQQPLDVVVSVARPGHNHVTGRQHEEGPLVRQTVEPILVRGEVLEASYRLVRPVESSW